MAAVAARRVPLTAACRRHSSCALAMSQDEVQDVWSGLFGVAAVPSVGRVQRRTAAALTQRSVMAIGSAIIDAAPALADMMGGEFVVVAILEGD